MGNKKDEEEEENEVNDIQIEEKVEVESRKKLPKVFLFSFIVFFFRHFSFFLCFLKSQIQLMHMYNPKKKKISICFSIKLSLVISLHQKTCSKKKRKKHLSVKIGQKKKCICKTMFWNLLLFVYLFFWLLIEFLMITLGRKETVWKSMYRQQ